MGLAVEDVAAAVGDGVTLAPALRVGVALAERVSDADAGVPAVDVARADGDSPTGAADFTEGAADAPLGLSSGACASADDSPAVCFARSCSTWPPPDDEEKANPATSAATDAAPTAPTATATCLARRPPAPRAARRRSARPGPGAADATLGSSRVSSYALSQPCAEAGSRYSSYTGAGPPSGR
ncbi:hypothetical protein ACIRBZ_29180 [Streptomyces sp. NPDC094038]|uniref:hypothetical protein n=1 Tax=Streptomyces sp. NPDC094038 TaxID=3366055 RepID=UPI0037FEB31B